MPVYTFKDADANPISIGGGPCELAVNGVGMCRQEFVGSFVDRRARPRRHRADRNRRDEHHRSAGHRRPDDRRPRQSTSLIGGLGNDILKGNDGRDSLRGREGADIYKGGRGRDTLQTLDGIRDAFISCGDGNDDFLRKDAIDPRGRHCELSNHKNPSKP